MSRRLRRPPRLETVYPQAVTSPAAHRPRPLRRALLGLALGLGLLLFGTPLLVLFSRRPPSYRLPDSDRPARFEDHRRARLLRSQTEGARPGNEERFVPATRPDPPVALVYVHGFVASRAEGEPVVVDLAQGFDLPAWFLRLPGHGTSPEDLEGRRFSEWIDEVDLTLRAARDLAPKLAVVATSMGAALATYLAAERPGLVDALVLVSPFFAFRDPVANILLPLPGGLALAEAVVGETRRVPYDPDDPEDHRLPGFEAFWYTAYPLSAVAQLAQVSLLVNRDELLRRVEAPSLLLYYPGDVAADVSAMRAAQARFPTTALRRTVEVQDGDHVLLSRWVEADRDRARAAVADFLVAVFPELRRPAPGGG